MEGLHEVAKAGNVAKVKELVEEGGVPVDLRDSQHWTPLIESSYEGQAEVVVTLIDLGADVNAVNDVGFSALTRASRQGHLEIVKILAAKGANIHHRAAAGNSALMFAAMSDRLPVCEFLLSLGADLMAVNDANESPITQYGIGCTPALSPEVKAQRCAALEAAWAEGPHPSQVQRRLLGKGPWAAQN